MQEVPVRSAGREEERQLGEHRLAWEDQSAPFERVESTVQEDEPVRECSVACEELLRERISRRRCER